MVLGLVLLAAGALKLREPTWPEQAHAFGAPRWAVPLVPWVEIVLGALLVPGLGGAWTAGAAIGMVGAFTVLVVVRMVQGSEAPCACFGALTTGRARPVGPATLARNAALVALGVLALLA